MRSLSHGFTLMELLTVIAVLLLLTAVLYPVFASVRQTPKTIANFDRQTYLAAAATSSKSFLGRHIGWSQFGLQS